MSNHSEKMNETNEKFERCKSNLFSQIIDEYNHNVDLFYIGQLTKKEFDTILDNLKYRVTTINVATNYELMKNDPLAVINQEPENKLFQLSDIKQNTEPNRWSTPNFFKFSKDEIVKRF